MQDQIGIMRNRRTDYSVQISTKFFFTEHSKEQLIELFSTYGKTTSFVMFASNERIDAIAEYSEKE